jgi:hypothetical protein
VSLGRRTLVMFFVVSLSLITIGFELYYFTQTFGGASKGTAWINGTEVSNIMIASHPFTLRPYLDLGLRVLGSGTVIFVATLFESLPGKRRTSILAKICRRLKIR